MSRFVINIVIYEKSATFPIYQLLAELPAVYAPDLCKVTAESIYRLKCQFSPTMTLSVILLKTLSARPCIDVDGRQFLNGSVKGILSDGTARDEDEGGQRNCVQRSQTVKMFTYFSRLSSETTFMFCFVLLQRVKLSFLLN